MAKMRFMNKKKDIPVSSSAALSESLSFIEMSLRELGIQQKLGLRTVLLTEELLPQFIQNSAPETKLRIQVQKFLGDASVSIHVAASLIAARSEGLLDIEHYKS